LQAGLPVVLAAVPRNPRAARSRPRHSGPGLPGALGSRRGPAHLRAPGDSLGQRGYGLSVFTGRTAERFEVEVVGVMRNVNPDNSYILARLTGHGLEKSGVIAG